MVMKEENQEDNITWFSYKNKIRVIRSMKGSQNEGKPTDIANQHIYYATIVSVQQTNDNTITTVKRTCYMPKVKRQKRGQNVPKPLVSFYPTRDDRRLTIN